jgi:hypothetical protein
VRVSAFVTAPLLAAAFVAKAPRRFAASYNTVPFLSRRWALEAATRRHRSASFPWRRSLHPRRLLIQSTVKCSNPWSWTMTNRSIALFARFWTSGRRKQGQVESPYKVLLNEIRYSTDAFVYAKRMGTEAHKSWPFLGD